MALKRQSMDGSFQFYVFWNIMCLLRHRIYPLLAVLSMKGTIVNGIEQDLFTIHRD